MQKEKLSPMMQHYVQVKEKYKDTIVFYRLGDFYEVFFDDAVVVSKILELTLTGRACGLKDKAPMCGVPYHAVDKYINKLVRNGKKVAICEQLTEASAKKMVERDVVRVITPGTIMEDNMLEASKNNYIASCFYDKKNIGITWADLTTGEFNMVEFKSSKAFKTSEDFLMAINPAEIICNDLFYDEICKSTIYKSNKLNNIQNYYSWAFSYQTAYKKLLKQFNTTTLEPFECEGKKQAISSAGALVEYLIETQKRDLSHINKVQYIKNNDFMVLDYKAIANLELLETLNDKKKKGSLLGVLDHTKTSMGARNLRKWIEQPLQDEKFINYRLDAVNELIEKDILRNDLVDTLKSIRDIERLAGKIAYGAVMPRDCLSILESIKVMPEFIKSLSNFENPIFKNITENFDCMTDVCNLLKNGINENAPLLLKDGGFIKNGYNKELDEYRSARNSAKQWLAEVEVKEKEETGIKNLKIGFNKVFGYYIEISKSNLDQVPFRYVRKQTLTNGERFITEELKVLEDKILNAEDKAIKLEHILYKEIVGILGKNVNKLQFMAHCVAVVDCLTSFAIVSVNNNYCKPTINSDVKHIKIEEGRHPVVENLIGLNDFVSNDTYLDNKDDSISVITGPNMAGKSTYMRQVALIVLMAHIGCFVPATSAEISIVDRIFTRVGASDDLSVGQSTFMVEMIEVASILNNATENSLLILDEIGRGTSTFDGLSIAWSVMEYISEKIGAKTLFATHYHELTELEGKLKGVKNYRILIKEFNDTIIFLHKIVRGGANKSFGIEVASLAGVPNEVIKQAKKFNKRMEKSNINMQIENKNTDVEQMSLFVGSKESEIIDMLKDTNINNITPMQALAILSDLKGMVKE